MAKRTPIIHLEGVPNPNAMKLVLENGILTDQPYEFTAYATAEGSPLARKLLLLKYIDRVLINFNYITIVKKPQTPAWDDLLFQIRAMVHEHLESDEPIIYVGTEELKHPATTDALLEVVHSMMNRGIRPAAQADGGDIVVDSYENGTLRVTMHGSCSGCPYASQTISQGLEPLLAEYVPEVRRVEVVNR